MGVFRFMLDYVERVGTGDFAVRVRGTLNIVNFLLFKINVSLKIDNLFSLLNEYSFHLSNSLLFKIGIILNLIFNLMFTQQSTLILLKNNSLQI